ncbi:MAG TPA: ABC transporter permease [Nitrospira sp.]|nr:ABC transporter permease [Nitrospira sp.]
MMWNIGVIAINTFRENLRDKILYNLLFFALALISASLLLAHMTFVEQHRIITDMGLAAINAIGVLIGIFVGIGLVSREIERRTIYTIMARPLKRWEFILGKYAGLALTLSINILIMLVVYLATLVVSGATLYLSLFQAVGLIFVEVLLVTAIAMFFSTFTSSTLSAIMTIGCYVIGHLTSDLRGVAVKTQNEAVKGLMNALYYLCPNLDLLNIKGQAASGVGVSISYEMLAAGYGLLYAAALIVGACVIFERRDF